MRVECISQTAGRAPLGVIRRDLIRAAGLLRHAGQPLEILGLVFISRGESLRLNRRYRRARYAAGVLSFRYNGYGEILLAPAVIRAEARRIREPFRWLIRRLAVHGLLHLLGYNHESSSSRSKNFERQEEDLHRALGLV